MSWIPIMIATGSFRGGSSGGSDDDSIYKIFAECCFGMSLVNGIAAAGWYGAIFASRRIPKRTPVRTVSTRWVRKNGSVVREYVNDPTLPEIIGFIPLGISGAFGFFSMIMYGMYLIERGPPLIRKKQSSDRDETH